MCCKSECCIIIGETEENKKRCSVFFSSLKSKKIISLRINDPKNLTLIEYKGQNSADISVILLLSEYVKH